MATDTSTAFKSAAAPTPPGSNVANGEPVPPVTPSQQVANQQHGLHQGPTPPALGGQAVINQTHRDAMQRDQGKSDQANHYSRAQTPAVSEHIRTIGKLFAKQAAKKQDQLTKGPPLYKGHEH